MAGIRQRIDGNLMSEHVQPLVFDNAMRNPPDPFVMVGKHVFTNHNKRVRRIAHGVIEHEGLHMFAH